MQQQQDAELRTLLERLGVRSLEEALRLVQDSAHPTPYQRDRRGARDPPANVDILVPDRRVAEEFGVSLMSIWRWSHSPTMEFPPAIKINNRNFRSRRLLEEFKARMLRQALANRSGESKE